MYQYVVKNKVQIKDAPNGHMVTSTLDPVSYIAYNGGKSLLEVDLLRTWICPGYTGLSKQTCNSPYGSLPEGVIK